MTEYMHIVCVRVCMDLDIYREILYGIIYDKDNFKFTDVMNVETVKSR